MVATRGAGTDYFSEAHEFTPVLSGARVAQPLVFCIILCRSLCIILSPLFCPLCCLSFDLHAHDEWSIRDLLHWQNYPSLPITFPYFESRGV
jgi:hypothetical protein